MKVDPNDLMRSNMKVDPNDLVDINNSDRREAYPLKNRVRDSSTKIDLDEELKKARAAKREWISILCSAYRMHALKSFDQGGDIGKTVPEFLEEALSEFRSREFKTPPADKEE